MRRTGRRLATALAVVGSAAVVAPAAANHGALDPFFGNLSPTLGGGISTLTVAGKSDRVHDVMGLPDGKILVGGRANGLFGVARYRSNGTLDPAWGGDGLTTVGSLPGRVLALGRGNALPLLAAGTARIAAQPGAVMMLRGFNADGTVNTAFGAGGATIVGFGSDTDGVATAMAVDAPPPPSPTSPSLTPVIALGGFRGSDTAGGARQPVVVLVGNSGDVLTGFGTGGVVQLPNANAWTASEVTGVAFDGQRRVVVVGTGSKPGQPTESWVMRLTLGGALDTSFGGGDGIVFGRFGCGTGGVIAATALRSVLVDPNGRIVAAGSCAQQGAAMMVRLREDGSADPAFSGDGTATVPGTNGALSLNDVLRQLDGTLVGAGSAFVDGANRLALVAVTDIGLPKVGFGAGGVVTTLVPGTGSSTGNAVTTVADGNLVAGGIATFPDRSERFLLAKYHARRDPAAPRGTVSLVDRTVSSVRARRAIRVRVRSTEPVRAALVVRIVGGPVIARGEAPYARGRNRVVAVPLTALGRRVLATRAEARVRVLAEIRDVADKEVSLAGAGRLG